MKAMLDRVLVLGSNITAREIELVHIAKALLAERDEAVAIIRDVEHAGEAGSCPSCGGTPHMPFCRLAAAIARQKEVLT